MFGRALSIRRRRDELCRWPERHAHPPFGDPFCFLAHARALRTAGVQFSLGFLTDLYAEALHGRTEEAGRDLEGIVWLPHDESNLESFGSKLRTAKQAGAAVVRTAMLSGRCGSRGDRGSPLAWPAVVRLAPGARRMQPPAEGRPCPRFSLSC